MRRLVLPLFIPILVVLGLLVTPTSITSKEVQAFMDEVHFAADQDSQSHDAMATTLSEVLTASTCGCQPRALDLYYILDLSGSMGQLGTDGRNKLEIAQAAISQTNSLIASWNNGSQVGLITYNGSGNGTGSPPVYGVETTNQLAFRPFWGGLTDNLTTFNNKLFAVSANGGTPTYHALDFSEGEMELDNADERLPVFILLSDGVPTISSERYSFNDADVQAINIIDPETGEFRPIEDVRADGVEGPTGYYAGEPLADVMEEINAVKQNHSEYIYHALAIQGEPPSTFNPQILQYVAHVGGGIFANSSNLNGLMQALQDVINSSGCDLDLEILPEDQTYVAEECPFCGNRERQHYAGSINTFSGNYHHRATDIAVDTFGSALYFERSYNSLPVAGDVVYSEPLGYGWTHNYNVRLVFPDDVGGEQNTIIMQAARGSRMRFIEQGDGSYEPYAGVWADLVAEGSGYAVTAANQQRFMFNSSGQLTTYFDPQGNERSFAYTNNKLSRVTEPISGRWLDFAYNSQNRLGSVTDHTGRQVLYGYQNDDLVVVTDTRGLPWTYSYGGTHRLSHAYDPDGRLLEQVFYNSEGRAKEQMDGLARSLVEIDYAVDRRVITQTGSVMSATYSAQNLLIAELDAENNEHRYAYDQYFNRVQTTDANGNQTCEQQSRFGLPLTTIDAEGNSSSYEYDENNNLIAMTDTLGYTTYYGYDEQNNLSAMTDTLGHVTTYSYNDLGLVTLQSDANNHPTFYGYDQIGQSVAITDAQGNSSTFGYDDLGRLITTTNATGQVHLNEYDNAGQLVRTTNNYLANEPQLNHAIRQNGFDEHVNLVTDYEYDGFGRQIALTDTLGKVTRHDYDDAGRLVNTIQNYTTNPALPANEYNLVTSYGYDEFGRQNRVTDTLGYVSLTQYDDVGRIEYTIANYQDGIYDATYPDEDIITRFAYDGNGNLVSSWDVAGRETRTVYDTLNRVSRTIVNHQDGFYDPAEPDTDIITRYQYDSAGNQIASVDTEGSVSQNFYDAANRLITTLDPLSGTSRYEYDSVGNQVVFTDANGYATLTSYDSLNRRVVMSNTLGETTSTEYDALGNQIVITNARGYATSYEYDNFNRVVIMTDALAYTTHHSYDALGRRLTTTDANGRVTRNEYDSLGRVQQITRHFVEGGPVNDDTNVTTSVTYDALGRRTTVTDANEHVTSYQYDGLGRTVAVTDALAHATSFTYDGLGNRLTVTNAEEETTHYAYDNLNRLLTVTNPLSFATIYEYDGIGNRVAMTDAEGVQSCYSYDALDRLSSVTENCLVARPSSNEQNVTTFYAYDALGNRTVITNALGHLSTFTYDPLNRLAAERDALGNTTHYAYDEVGSRNVLTDANGAVTTFVYDPGNRLTTIDYPNGQPDVTFSYDPLGNRLTMQDESGSTTYVYDGLYRLTESTNGAKQTVGYGYNAVGNRTLLTHADSKVSYTYDDANRLETVLNTDGLYDYDYDDANRLTLLTFPTGMQSSYDYDDAGQLIALTHSQESEILADYDYLLDKVGNRTIVTETLLTPMTSLAGLTPPDSSFTQEPAAVVEEALSLIEQADSLVMPNLYSEPTLVTYQDKTTESPKETTQEMAAVEESSDSGWFEHVTSQISQDEYQISRLAFSNRAASGAEYQAPNRAHNLRSHFSDKGIHLESRQEPNWQWEMQLVAYRNSDTAPVVTDNRIQYEREGLTEWYINDEEGLQQGFTLNQAATLELALSYENLNAEFVSDGTAIEFGTDKGTLLRYNAPVVRDAKGQVVASQLEVLKDKQEGPIKRILLKIDDEADYPVTVRSLLTSPDWQVNGSQSAEGFGFAVSSAGDVNGDGYEDVLVAAPTYDIRGAADAGRVLLYLGSKYGLSKEHIWQTTGRQKGERFGAAISGAGDLNRNGYNEIIIGAPGYLSERHGTDTGKAYLYGWASRGMRLLWSAEGEQKGAQFGYAVANAGDVNRDRYDDLLIGAPQHANKGRVYLYRGGSTLSKLSPYQTLNGTQTYARFGAALGTAGHVNNDTYPDIVIGAPNYDSRYRDRGRVYVYHGSSGSVIYRWTKYGSRSNEQFGFSVSSAGDVNGDGYDDLLIGAPTYNYRYSNQGHLVVYLGSSRGLSNSIHWRAESRKTNAQLGYSVADAGDFNRDGYDDIIVGAPYYDSRGAAFVYHGSRTGLNANLSRPLGLPSNADLYIEGIPNTLLGVSVDTAGDANGDGYSDVIIGAPKSNDLTRERGIARVYYGNDDPIEGLSASNDSPTEVGQITKFEAKVTAGSNIHYHWSFGDGTTATGARPSHTYAQPGTYTAKVKASNNANTLTASTIVKIIDQPISGLIAENDSPTELGQVTHFNASVATGTNVQYTWDFGDGSSATGAAPSHTYSQAGTYTARVTASNSNNQQTAETIVTINASIGKNTRITQYTYDPLYRLTDANYSTGEQFAYTYDGVGNRLTMENAEGTTSYSYDAANRLEEVNGTTYTYDANGNLQSDGTSTYTYDHANRLTSASDNKIKSTYLYDGLGNRLAQSVDGTTTQYTLDIAGGLPEVITENTNGQTTHYLQVGGQLLAQQQSGTWSYMLPDHLGSVRQLTDAQGNITLVQNYTPFGEVMESSGSDESAFGFTGEQSDETRLLFLRARYYAPRRGSFLSVDPFAGWAEQPYSQHPYQYGYSNPLRYTDPTGHFVCGTKEKPCPKNPWPFKPIPLGTGCQVLDVIGKLTLNLGCQMIGGVCKVEGSFLVEASSEEYLQTQADSVFALATPIKYPTNRKGWIKVFKELGIEDTSEALKSPSLKRALNNVRFFNQRGIRITGHALQRMQERGISEKQVLELYKGKVTRTFYEALGHNQYTIVNQGFNQGLVVDKTGQIISVLGNKNHIRTAYQYTSSLSVFDLPETLRKMLY